MLEYFVDILEKAKTDIQARMESEDINASGRSSASLVVERYDGGVRLKYGNAETAPLPTLEIGRPGGNVPKGFTDILEQWSRDKGIPFDTDRQRRTFAYLLGRRIAREGTLRNTHPVDVYTSIILDTVDFVKADVVKMLTVYIHNQLRQE